MVHDTLWISKEAYDDPDREEDETCENMEKNFLEHTNCLIVDPLLELGSRYTISFTREDDSAWGEDYALWIGVVRDDAYGHSTCPTHGGELPDNDGEEPELTKPGWFMSLPPSPKLPRIFDAVDTSTFIGRQQSGHCERLPAIPPGPGQVVTLQLDTRRDKNTLRFWLNGRPYGPQLGGVTGPAGLRFAASFGEVKQRVAIVPNPELEPWPEPASDSGTADGAGR